MVGANVALKIADKSLNPEFRLLEVDEAETAHPIKNVSDRIASRGFESTSTPTHDSRPADGSKPRTARACFALVLGGQAVSRCMEPIGYQAT